MLIRTDYCDGEFVEMLLLSSFYFSYFYHFFITSFAWLIQEKLHAKTKQLQEVSSLTRELATVR